LVFDALVNKKHLLFIDNELKPISDKLWTEISLDLGSKITPNSLYISVYQNRHGWKNHLYDLCGITTLCQTSSFNKTCDTSSSSSTEFNKNTVFFFTIPYQLFSSIMPCTTRYKKKGSSRSYNILKPYAWADVINDAFIKKHKLPCNFLYKRAKVSIDPSNTKHYITFQGKCKDCGENLFGWCSKKPKEFEPLEINISTKDTRGEELAHSSKRPLMGLKRQKIGKQLSSDIPANWRRQNTEEMDFDWTSPPNLYKNNVLS